MEGVVTDYATLGSLRVLGFPVDASSAQITGGPSGSVGNGVKVQVGGMVSNGVLKATRLKIRNVPGTGGPQYRVGSHRQFVLLARHLALAGTNYPWIRVSCRRHAERRGQIQISFASRVPDMHAFRPLLRKSLLNLFAAKAGQQ